MLTAGQVWLLLNRLSVVIVSQAPCLTSKSETAPKEGTPARGQEPCADLTKPRFHQQHSENCLPSIGQRFVSFVLFCFVFEMERPTPFLLPANHIPQILDSVPSWVSKPVIMKQKPNFYPEVTFGLLIFILFIFMKSFSALPSPSITTQHPTQKAHMIKPCLSPILPSSFSLSSDTGLPTHPFHTQSLPILC